jgi:hypothetical protein
VGDELIAKYANVAGCRDAESDPIAGDLDDGDNHFGADFDGLVELSTQYEHMPSPPRVLSAAVRGATL